MGVLDQVMQLKNQGMGDQDIVNNLQQQGIAPKEITDAINQASIKNAVSGPDAATAGQNYAPSPNDAAPQAAAPAGGAEQGYYSPQTQEMGAAPQAGYAQQAAPTEYYEEGAYQQPGGYAEPASGMDSDTMIEIANQVFAEKIKKTEKQLEEVAELKTIAQVKVKGIDERLKRMEKMIDTLQIQILEKVGSYSKDLQSTKKEVSMLEDTLGKTIKAKASKSSSSSKKTTKKTSKKKK
jgi:hypothetical protein